MRRTAPGSVAALLATLAAGCAGNEPAEAPVERDNVYIGEAPLYAVLERRGDGQWTFDEVVATNAAPDDGFLVRLNDLAPAFDTRQAECEPRPYRENDRCNPLNPFRDKDMGVIGKIVDTGINAGTGGKISSVSRSYTTAFDRLAFNAAVDQALLLTGLDEGRVELFEGIAALAQAVAEHEAAVNELAGRVIRDYERDRRESVVIELRVDGLEDYYSWDLDPADFVRIEAASPTYARHPDDDRIAELLPCPAADCIERLRQARRQLDREHQRHLESLRAKLAAQTDAYRVDCTATEYAGYHFELTCPDTLPRAGRDTLVLPVTMTIRSRDFPQLYPAFANADDVVAARVTQGELVLENLTRDFVDVQSLSLYYNSKINTVAEPGRDLDLAPRQRIAVPLADFSSPPIDIESTHANMTPDKASRTRFTFGIALKYSLRDRDAIETLYAVDDFNVQCAIENRLRPGSCDDEGQHAAAGTQAAPETGG